MVVPDVFTQNAPPTPSWSRSEDVRNSLNVLDQVLSEFDDQELEDEKFLEDKFDTTNHHDEEDRAAQKTSDVSSNNSKDLSNGREDASESVIEFKGPTLPRNDVHRNGGDGQANPPPPPRVDRTNKPKQDPPKLPKKVGGTRTNRQSSDESQSSDNVLDDQRGRPSGENSDSSASTARNDDNVDDGTVKSGKSTASNKSEESLITTSSGTHDYQEINSDLCEAIHNSHERRLEEEKQKQQQHQLFLKHQQHQKRILEENLNNAQQSRGRSLDPKRRSVPGGRESRPSARGRSSAPSDRKDRSSSRNQGEHRRSKSSERLLDSRNQRNHMREQLRDNILLPPQFQDHDPRYIELSMQDPRLMIGPNLMDPRLLDPRLGADPRLMEPHMLDPRYDHIVEPHLMYPMQDSMQFPHIMNYPDHMGPILPPEEFASSYHPHAMYPYDVPFVPELGRLTAEEIHHIRSGGDPSFLTGGYYPPSPHHYQMMQQQQYPVDYPMEYHHSMGTMGGTYVPAEYLGYPPGPPMDAMLGQVLQPPAAPPPPPPPPQVPGSHVSPGHLMMARGGDFAPPSPAEAQQTIDDLVRGSRQSLGVVVRTSDGPTPAQLVKELRRSTRHQQQSRPPVPTNSSSGTRRPNLPPTITATDTSDMSSLSYDDVGATGASGPGFCVGDVVRNGSGFVGSPGELLGMNGTGNGITTGPASMPHFSPAKDSGFDECPTNDDIGGSSGSLGRNTRPATAGGGSSSSRNSPNQSNAAADSTSCRTIGKTRGGMVVSGVLNNASNMYIPAPPSPTPDYDDEGSASDGGESDILKGSEFYVVEGGDGASSSSARASKLLNKKRKEKNTQKKSSDKKSSTSAGASNLQKTGKEPEENDSTNAANNIPSLATSIENDKSKNRVSTSSEDSKRDSLSDDSLKEGNNAGKSSRTNLPPNGKNFNEVLKTTSPLEKMMTKFHENLPPWMDETHFSDDSLEDSMAEESSTVFTSKPSTIDPKHFWNDSIDSVCSANESAASFDYVRANKPMIKNYNAKKMARSNSQSEPQARNNNLNMNFSNKAPRDSKFAKKSLSNSNLNASSSDQLPRYHEGSRAMKRQQIPQQDDESIVVGSTSTASSESAKFDTIRNMLKEGLIKGLDEEPPDFVPPPPFLHFENGSDANRNHNRIENDENSLVQPNKRNDNERRSPSRGDLSQFPLTKSREQASTTRSSLKNVAKLFSGKERTNSRSRDRKSVSRSSSKNTNDFERDENVIGGGNGFSVEDSPPPLPPPRESSLSTNKSQDSSRNSSWLHGPRLPSLKSKKNLNKSPTEKRSTNSSNRKLKSQASNESLNKNQVPEAEMMEVSIYTKTVRDGDKITHVDDFGNEIEIPNEENGINENNYETQDVYGTNGDIPSKCNEQTSDDPTKEGDFLENIKNIDPYRKRSESQPIISSSRSNGNNESPGHSRITDSNERTRKSPTNNETNANSKAIDNSERARGHSTNQQLNCRSICDSKPTSSSVNKPRPSSPTKKRQPPPPPPNKDVNIVSNSRYRSTEDLHNRKNSSRLNKESGASRLSENSAGVFSSQNQHGGGSFNQNQHGGGNFSQHQHGGGSFEQIEHGAGRLSSEHKELARFSSTAALSNAGGQEYGVGGSQDLRRTTSLLANNSKKGSAPPVPKVRTSIPHKGGAPTGQAPSPPSAGFMPADEAGDSKFRFNIFRGFMRRNKYSFDKA